MSTPSATVSITTSRIVQARFESSWQSLGSVVQLGPLDALVPAFIPIAVVFYYPQPDSTSPIRLMDIDLLQTALSRTLDLYPQLTGRLTPSEGGRTIITQLGSGAELIEAKCDMLFNEMTDSHLMTGSSDYLGPYDMSEKGIREGAIVRIQRTRFKCGSIALGIRISHKVCDGEGYFHFVRDLAGIYRTLAGAERGEGEMKALVEPITESYLFDLTLNEEAKANAREHKSSIMYTETTPPLPIDPAPEPTSTSTETSSTQPQKVIGRFIHYSSDFLAKLKATAQTPSFNPSTFTALSAFIFQRITQARILARQYDPHLPTLSSPQFLTPVGVRSRLSLPPRYFPNALICTCATPPLSTLQSGSLSEVAEYIHSATRISAVSDIQEIQKDLKWISAQEEISDIRHIFKGENGGVQISAWTRLGLYDGVGFEVQPRMVVPPFTEISLIDGLGYLIPTRNGDGLTLAMALSEKVWDALGDERRGWIR